MPSANCFDSPTLKDYLLGKLSDEQSDVVSSHLEACLNCEATVAELDRASDTLTNGLRLPALTAEPQTDDELQQALNKVQSLEALADHPTSKISADRSPVLRDYRLLEPLGSGGMGQVFKAVHTRLDRLVAVKLLPARRLGDDQAVARFQREMRVIGQLSHPAIVQATDAGEVDGTHFLVMEYVEGCDLNTLAKVCGPLSVADACEIARQAAVGLEYAHQQGIVHRDIKPSNLMLSRGEARGARDEGADRASVLFSPLAPHPSPLIKILDLGLALLSGVQAPVDELTTVGQLMGTLDYMAPEQLEDSHLVGPRADIYALAATLYRLLTGFAPFANESRKTPLQKLRALATQAAPPIRERRADLSLELAAIIDLALSRDPAARFPSMSEFAAALTPWCMVHDLVGLAQQAGRGTLPVTDAGCSLPGSLSPWERAGVREPSVGRRDSGNQTAGNEPSGIQQSASEQRRPSDRIPHPSPLPKGEGTGRRRSRFALGLLAFFGIAALGVVITIEFNKGTLIVESLREGVEVRVKKSGKMVDRLELTNGPKSTRLAAGEYEIEIIGDADGLQIQNGQFVLKRGDTVVAKVTEERPKATAPDVAGTMMAHPGISQRGLDVSDTSELPTEPDDEQPNPKAKSIDQWLADNLDAKSEVNYREAMRRKVDFKFDDNALKDVIEVWSNLGEIPIWLDEPALNEERIASDTPVTLQLKEVSLESAMVLALRPLKLAYFWDQTSVRITTATKANERLVNRMYPIGRSLPMVRKAVRLINEKSLATHEAILKAGGRPVGPIPAGGGGFFNVPSGKTAQPNGWHSLFQAVCEASETPEWSRNFHRRSPCQPGQLLVSNAFGTQLEASCATPTSLLLGDPSQRLHFQFGGGGGGGLGGGGTTGAIDAGGTVHPLLTYDVTSYYSKLLGLMTGGRWQLQDGEGGTIQLVGDVLIIRQTQPIHDQVVPALRLLEQAAVGPLPQSPIEIRRADYPFDAEQTLRKKLTQPAELQATDTSLTDVLAFLESQMEVRILLDKEKLNEEAIAEDSPITLTLKDVSFQVVLNRVLEPLKLAADVEEGMLIVTTQAALTERQVLKAYDVRDLLGRGIDSEELINALYATTGPWQDESGDGGDTMVLADRLLFVTQTRSNHAEIEEVLRLLRSQLSDQLPKKPLAQRFPKPQPVGGLSPTPKPVTPVTPPTQPTKANQPRYDGKTFDEWLAVLETERSPTRLKETFQALRVLKNSAQDEALVKRILAMYRSEHTNQSIGLIGGANIRPDISELLSSLKPTVLAPAVVEELRNGNSLSRRFTLVMLRKQPEIDIPLSVLEVSRDSDSAARREAMWWLVKWHLKNVKAPATSAVASRLRAALTDTESEIRFAAASGLRNSESDSKAVTEVLLQTLQASDKPSSSRVPALELVALMGSRAADAAATIVQLKLSPNDEPLNTTSKTTRWSSPRKHDRQFSEHELILLALSRMGKLATPALPTINEAIENTPPGGIPSILDRDADAHELLLATKLRIEETPIPQKLASSQDAKILDHDLARLQAIFKLLRLEVEFLQASDRNEEATELLTKSKSISDEFNDGLRRCKQLREDKKSEP